MCLKGVVRTLVCGTAEGILTGGGVSSVGVVDTPLNNDDVFWRVEFSSSSNTSLITCKPMNIINTISNHTHFLPCSVNMLESSSLSLVVTMVSTVTVTTLGIVTSTSGVVMATQPNKMANMSKRFFNPNKSHCHMA